MLRCTRSKIPTEVQRTHLCQLGSLAKFQQKPLQKKKEKGGKKKRHRYPVWVVAQNREFYFADRNKEQIPSLIE